MLRPLRHDHLIKYADFVKCYLERFASISYPEKKKTTNVAKKIHLTLLRHWRHKTRFPKREGLQTLILGIPLPEYYINSVNRKSALYDRWEMLFILLAI